MTTPFNSLGTQQDQSQALFFSADSLNLGDEFFSEAVESARVNTVATTTLASLPPLPEEFTWEELPNTSTNVLQPPALDPDFLRIVNLNREIIERDTRDNFNLRDVSPAETDLEEDTEDPLFSTPTPTLDVDDATANTTSPSEQELDPLDLSGFGADSIFSTPTPETVDEMTNTPSPSEQELAQFDADILTAEDPFLSIQTPLFPSAAVETAAPSSFVQEIAQPVMSAIPSQEVHVIRDCPQTLNSASSGPFRDFSRNSAAPMAPPAYVAAEFREKSSKMTHESDELMVCGQSLREKKKKKPALPLLAFPDTVSKEVQEAINAIDHKQIRELLRDRMVNPEIPFSQLRNNYSVPVPKSTFDDYRNALKKQFPHLSAILADKRGPKKRKASEMCASPKPLPSTEEIAKWIEKNIWNLHAQKILKEKLLHPEIPIESLRGDSISTPTLVRYRAQLTREFPLLKKRLRDSRVEN